MSQKTKLPSNIRSVKFLDTWPSGRPFKHGAMEITFKFPPFNGVSAKKEVEFFLEGHGLELSKDYHIPGWNFVSNGYYLDSSHNGSIIITFDRDEVFVMTKLGWSSNEEDDEQ